MVRANEQTSPLPVRDAFVSAVHCFDDLVIAVYCASGKPLPLFQSEYANGFILTIGCFSLRNGTVELILSET